MNSPIPCLSSSSKSMQFLHTRTRTETKNRIPVTWLFGSETRNVI